MSRFFLAALFLASLAAMPARLLANNPTAPAGSGLETLAQGLPEEFRRHFFNLPLAVRIELDGRLLGDAMVLLSEQGTLQLLEFTDAGDSPYTAAQRQTWLDLLGADAGMPLGAMTGQHKEKLLALHYNLENSMVSIVTAAAEHHTAPVADHYSLPEGGSSGLILRNSLNLNGGIGQSMAVRYGIDARGSIGNWTAVGNLETYQDGGGNAERHYALQNLYLQRELPDHFVKVGYFNPNAQGLVRQPGTRGGYAMTTVGLMAGSSEGLTADNDSASMYPVYVTADRQSTVEIYRDGVLIDSQPVQPGLQVIDTRRLPGGIYEIELRIMQDGAVAGRSKELIYKPDHWRNPQQRWRYSVFAGQQQSLLGSRVNSQAGQLAAGVAANYLLHPRATLGLSLQRLGRQTQMGASVDWQATENLSLYSNIFQTAGYGNGIDAYGTYRYDAGSIGLSHSRSWLSRHEIGGSHRSTPHTASRQRQEQREREADTRLARVQSSALNLTHRLSHNTGIGGRISHSSGALSGLGVDLSLDQRLSLFDTEATLRLSLFERPAGSSSRDHRFGGHGNHGKRSRNRGFDLTLNMALGKDGRQYSGSIGSRADGSGRRDQYGSVTMRQTVTGSALKNVAATAAVDSYGMSLSSNGSFEQRYVRGDGHLQRSSYNGRINGGLNLDSTIAISGGHVAADGQVAAGSADTGLIVDVESDVPDLKLRADDSGGPSAELRAGRNFIPVTAYRAGRVQFDFEGSDVPAAMIGDSTGNYHLNKGGVAYHRISVMKTVTVIGRLVDAGGQPLAGAHVVNHAGRSVTQADGFFVVEMQESEPTLEIGHADARHCSIVLDSKGTQREGDTLMAGERTCS